MKSITRLLFTQVNNKSHHEAKTERINQPNQFHRHARMRCSHILSILILTASFSLVCETEALGQESGGGSSAGIGGPAGIVQGQPPQRVSRRAGGGMPAGSAGAFSDRLQAIVGSSAGFSSRSSVRPLLVFISRSDGKVQRTLQEDLTVMSHILDKSIAGAFGSDQRPPNAMGVELYFWPEAGPLRQAYLEGYGALFLLNVNFPLYAPPPKGDPQKEEPPRSSAWEEARAEVFGEPWTPAGAVPDEPYNEEKVTRLTTCILEALKSAANIRDLKGQEGITVCVKGGTTKPAAGIKSLLPPGPKAGDSAVLSGTAEDALPTGTILSIRVKKSDVDAFAKGQLELSEFRQKALITIYETDVGGSAVYGRYSTAYGGYGIGYGGGMSKEW